MALADCLEGATKKSWACTEPPRVAMLVSGQYDRAIVALNQIIGKAPSSDAFARMLRARAYLAKKDPADAMTDLNLVLGKRPKDGEALALRSIAYSATREIRQGT